MELDFQTTFPDLSSYEEVYTHLMKKTFRDLGLMCEPIVSVSLVDNQFIHQMNRDYRHIDRPTDVISFAFLDGTKNREEILKNPGQLCSLGDIYISVDKAKEQAIEYGHSLKRELEFLFIHGLLHLIGYDHMTLEDEKIMFDLQDQILGKRSL
ncbi:MAG: rRNA maturation RNase YbeY [Bacilli bacterium]